MPPDGRFGRLSGQPAPSLRGSFLYSAFPDKNSSFDFIESKIFPRLQAGSPVDIHCGNMTRSQFVSRDGKDSCPCPHIQNGFSPPKIFLKRKEAPFRCAVSAGAECSLDIEKNPFSVFMGIRDGLSLSGDQDCFADDSRFPEPETALLPLVLDERLDTFMGKFNRRHKKRTISRMIHEDGGCWFPFFSFPQEPVSDGTCS